MLGSISETSYKRALALVAARGLSGMGTVLTGFALDVWLFEQLHSYPVFALLAVLNTLPVLLLSPVAGVLADKLPRKSIIVLCDVGAAACVLGVSLLSLIGALKPSHVVLTCVLLSLLRTFSWPASFASISALAGADTRTRVNGIAETIEGGILIAGPVLGVVLYKLVGLSGVALLDVASYVACIAIVSAISFPVIGRESETKSKSGSVYARWIEECVFGFRWLARHRDLSRLLLFFLAINMGCSIFSATYVPYVLSFATPDALAIALMLGGGGTVLGGAILAATGGFRRPVTGVLCGAFSIGVSMVGFGLGRTVATLYVFAFTYGAFFPVMNASSQTIWQTRVPPDIQGRVFSIRRMVAWGLCPMFVLTSVPLVELIFSPLLSSQRALSLLWGEGQVGALGMIASFCGILCMALACAAGLAIRSERVHSKSLHIKETTNA